MLPRLLFVIMVLCGLFTDFSAAGPAPFSAADWKIAVTELAYADKVQDPDRPASIDRGELYKFTADLKGELIKAGFELVQGRPFTMQNTAKLFDIIDHIKQGYYKGATHVLFGRVSHVEFRNDPVVRINHVWSHCLNLTLVAEFSLINTQSYATVAAFSSIGEGSDVRLVSTPNTVVAWDRSKMVQEVSRSLGIDVVMLIQGQLKK